MLYIINYGYSSGTAAMNRIQGYLKTLSEQKIETTLVSLFPSEVEISLNESYPHVSYRFLWKEFYYSKQKIISILLRYI